MKVLLVKNRNIGDALLATSSLRYLQSVLPSAEVNLAVPKFIAPIFKNTDLASSVIPLDLKTVSGSFESWMRITDLAPDYIHELHQTGRGSKFFNAMSWCSSSQYYYHSHHSDIRHKLFIPDQGEPKEIIQRDLDGVWALACTLRKETLPRPNFLDFRPNFIPAKKREQRNEIIFGIVASRQTKRWSIENFARLANTLVNQDPGVLIRVPVSPSTTDQRLAEKLRELCSEVTRERVLVEYHPLRALPEELQSAKLYIGNDTGLKHLCVALGLSTITFFGPEPPREWHPYNQKDHPYFYIEPLECRTRITHFCALDTCESMVCMGTSPEMVLAKSQELLNE